MINRFKDFFGLNGYSPITSNNNSIDDNKIYHWKRKQGRFGGLLKELDFKNLADKIQCTYVKLTGDSLSASNFNSGEIGGYAFFSLTGEKNQGVNSINNLARGTISDVYNTSVVAFSILGRTVAAGTKKGKITVAENKNKLFSVKIESNTSIHSLKIVEGLLAATYAVKVFDQNRQAQQTQTALRVWSYDKTNGPSQYFFEKLEFQPDDIVAIDLENQNELNKTIVVASKTGKIYHCDGNKSTYFEENIPTISCLKLGRSNEIFIGSDSGCFCFNTNTRTLYEISNDPVKSIDYKDSILFVGEVGEIKIFQRESTSYKFIEKKTINLDFMPTFLKGACVSNVFFFAAANATNLVVFKTDTSK